MLLRTDGTPVDALCHLRFVLNRTLLLTLLGEVRRVDVALLVEDGHAVRGLALAGLELLAEGAEAVRLLLQLVAAEELCKERRGVAPEGLGLGNLLDSFKLLAPHDRDGAWEFALGGPSWDLPWPPALICRRLHNKR